MTSEVWVLRDLEARPDLLEAPVNAALLRKGRDEGAREVLTRLEEAAEAIVAAEDVLIPIREAGALPPPARCREILGDVLDALGYGVICAEQLEVCAAAATADAHCSTARDCFENVRSCCAEILRVFYCTAVWDSARVRPLTEEESGAATDLLRTALRGYSSDPNVYVPSKAPTNREVLPTKKIKPL